MTMNAQLERARNVAANLPPLASRHQVDSHDLVAILQEPGALFGAPSENTAMPDEYVCSLDRAWLSEVLDEIRAHRGLTQNTIMEVLQIAAEMARARALKICAGNTFKIWVFDVGTEDVRMRYVLRLDAPHSVAAQLDDDLTWHLCGVDMCHSGFEISFAGEWTEEEIRRFRMSLDDEDLSDEEELHASVRP
jgi:hypothetical protein